MDAPAFNGISCAKVEVFEFLEDAENGLSGMSRALCRVRNGTLYERFTALTDTGQIVGSPEGYRLATAP